MGRLIRDLGRLSQQAFGEALLARVYRERPDIVLQMINPFYLVVGSEPGKQRVVPLLTVYQNYCAAPHEKDELLEGFLSSFIYKEPPVIAGRFRDNRGQILPQILPQSMIEFSIKDHQPLAVLPFVAGLSIAFVVDEPERYSYINQSVMERWQVCEEDLLAVALTNLRAISLQLQCHQEGEGKRAVFTFENHDGYDASRLLLGRMMVEVSAQVAGQIVVAIPHRDALMVFGDADPEFVDSMSDQVERNFEVHSYPITAELLTFVNGDADLYKPNRWVRVVN